MGQAQNQESSTGHHGVADAPDTKTKNNPDAQKKDQRKQNKPEKSNDDRTLTESQAKENRRLKTIDKVNESESKGDDEKKEDDEEKDSNEADEYQHVKEGKENDKTTMDSATEEQSKKAKHDENSQNDEDVDGNDELMEVDDDEQPNQDVEPIENMQLDDLDKKPSENLKKQKKNELTKEFAENQEAQVEGEEVLTHSVQRGNETTAHTKVEWEEGTHSESTAMELLKLREMVDRERMSTTLVKTDAKNYNLWQEISNKMSANAQELCEQLRLILEPTKCTRLKGDYRTGRRINMRKIIPYIASQFRKDKIWLRRTKPAQRDYKISIAIDDSRSMDHNQSKNMTLKAISLVSQALTLLESGKLNVISFGESPKILLNYHEQFDGMKLVTSLNFDQNQSRIAELLDFIRVFNMDDMGAQNGLFENLLIIVSDGRNIFSEGEQKVKNSIKLARLQRIFIVYVIIDNPENKHSILDIRVPKFSPDGQLAQMQSYLDTFPFSYYVIVRDLDQLPIVLSEAMRQWFELVNSEQ